VRFIYPLSHADPYSANHDYRSPHADQETVNYIHAYISFSYRKGVSYMSVYLQTFETGDWPVSKLLAHLMPKAKSCANLVQPIAPSGNTSARIIPSVRLSPPTPMHHLSRRTKQNESSNTTVLLLWTEKGGEREEGNNHLGIPNTVEKMYLDMC
jgi:hypothetical protein